MFEGSFSEGGSNILHYGRQYYFAKCLIIDFLLNLCYFNDYLHKGVVYILRWGSRV
jgi:hypothetical protein